jgi:hypothetical protein
MYKMKIEESHNIFKKLTNHKMNNKICYVRFEVQFFFFKFLFYFQNWSGND